MCLKGDKSKVAIGLVVTEGGKKKQVIGSVVTYQGPM